MVHGYGGYVRGCRCDVCKLGTREYQREYRKRLKDMSRCKHGTLSGYTNFKCRCDACRSAWSAYQADHHRQNKAELLTKSAARYERQKEHVLAKKKERDQTPQGRKQSSIWAMSRRARKLGQFIEDVDRTTVYTMHGGRCGICGEFIDGPFDVDHVKPLSRGGMHGYINVQPSHPSCNRKKYNRV